VAGESAREVARRRREKAESLQRMADAYERGAEGEEATELALAALPAEEWTIFHDIAWPGRTYANIDHVVVGPGGVFVVDSKNWSGDIEVAKDVLRQNGRSREKAVAGAAAAALAVAELVPGVGVPQVHAVLCFVREAELTGWAGDVMVCSTTTLVKMITSRPVVLGPEDVRTACLEFDAQFGSALAPRPRQQGRAPHSSGPTAKERRQVAKRAKAKKEARGSLIKGALLAVVVLIIYMNPQVLSGAADLFTRLITSRD
jgi:hypothetical protein